MIPTPQRPGLVLAGLLLLAAASPAQRALADTDSEAHGTQLPNILFLYSDDQSYYTVGTYGDVLADTPVLDELASQGIVFEQGFSNALFCKPARNTLFASWYPHQHGWFTNQVVETQSEPTACFPALLRQSGYETAAVGKWHSTLSAQEVGFNSYTYTQDPDVAARQFMTAQAGNSQPWFLFVAFQETHGPWVDPRLPRHRPMTAQHGHNIQVRSNVNARRVRKPAAQDVFEEEGFRKLERQGLDPEQATQALLPYFEEAHYLDNQIGRILGRLESLGLTDNTLVVYTSDQGAMAGNHYLWYKGPAAYEELVHVPMIMRWPAGIEAGRRSEILVSTVDLAPTLLEAAGLASPSQFIGRSVLPELRGEPFVGPDFVVTELGMDAPLSGHIRMLQTREDFLLPGRWKIVLNQGDEDELYQLSVDPFEKHNLSTHASYLSEYLLLRALLVDWMTDNQDPAAQIFQ